MCMFGQEINNYTLELYQVLIPSASEGQVATIFKFLSVSCGILISRYRVTGPTWVQQHPTVSFNHVDLTVTVFFRHGMVTILVRRSGIEPLPLLEAGERSITGTPRNNMLMIHCIKINSLLRHIWKSGIQSFFVIRGISRLAPRFHLPDPVYLIWIMCGSIWRLVVPLKDNY